MQSVSLLKAKLGKDFEKLAKAHKVLYGKYHENYDFVQMAMVLDKYDKDRLALLKVKHLKKEYLNSLESKIASLPYMKHPKNFLLSLNVHELTPTQVMSVAEAIAQLDAENVPFDSSLGPYHCFT